MSSIPLTRHPGGKWELLADHVVTVRVRGLGPVRIHPPKGFRFDLASVPWFFRRLVPKDSLGLEGPLAHDWLYQHAGGACQLGVAGGTAWIPAKVSRADSDLILRELVKIEDGRHVRDQVTDDHHCIAQAGHGARRALLKVWLRARREILKGWLWLRRWGAFYAVRVGGWLEWSRSKRRIEAGGYPPIPNPLPAPPAAPPPPVGRRSR